MKDTTIARGARRLRFAEQGTSVALMASWGVGMWLVVNLVDVAALLAH